MVSQVATIVLKFITLKVFYIFLGPELMGIGVAMESVFGLLSLSELGISSAVAFQLYKPLSENNKKSISDIMSTYKQLYQRIALFILFLSIALIPVFPFFIKNISINKKELNIIYFMYVLKTVSTYFLSYNRILLYADQKAYLYSATDTIFEMTFTILQISTLIICKNYYIYLELGIAKSILCNLIIKKIVKNLYSLPKQDKFFKKSIFLKIWKNTKEIIPVRVAAYIYQTSDNIIVSSVLGAMPLAYLTNYKKILSTAGSLFSQTFNQITPFVGKQKYEAPHLLNIYLKIVYTRYVFASFFIVEWIVLATPFVSFYFGSEFILNNITVLLLAMVQYGGLVFIGPFYNIMEGTGLFSYLKKIESVRASVNLTISLALVFHYGINGVLFGTICSDMIGFLLASYYFFVNILDLDKKHLKDFFLRNAAYILLVAIESIIIIFLNYLFFEFGFILKLIINIFLGFFLVILFNCFIFSKNEQFLFLLMETRSIVFRLASYANKYRKKK